MAVKVKKKVVKKKKKRPHWAKGITTTGVKKMTSTEWKDLQQRTGYLTEVIKNLGGGQPKAFSSPAELAHAAEAYFEWCNDNPWVKEEWKDKRHVHTNVGRPFTWKGLCIRLGVSEKYFNAFRFNLKNDPRIKEYLNVIDSIGEIIHTQKFEGASIGAFNSNLIAYDLGLKKDVPTMIGGGNSLTINVMAEGQNNLLEDVKKMLEAIDIEHQDVTQQLKLNGNGKSNGKH